MAANRNLGGLPNTTYHKVRDVLQVASTMTDPDLEELGDAIVGRNFDSLSYWAPRTESGDRRRQCSASTVRRAIRFVRSLGLLTIENRQGTCRLTPDGRNAMRPGQFDTVVADRAQRRLQELGYGYQKLVRVMQSVRHPEVPEAKTLYEKRPAAAETLGEAEFRQLLGLMADSGAFVARNARLFFPAE